jgi:hypothetical protein
MKDRWKKWWNPAWWLEAVFSMVSQVISGILRFFGLGGSQQRPAHADIQPDDVDQAYSDATEKAAVSETTGPAFDQRVQMFLRYVGATPGDRASIDLSSFGQDEQDFILGLSEADLEMLRDRGPVGIIQAILVRRIPEWSVKPPAPELLPKSSLGRLTRERLLRSVHRVSEQEAAEEEFRPMALR